MIKKGVYHKNDAPLSVFNVFNYYFLAICRW